MKVAEVALPMDGGVRPSHTYLGVVGENGGGEGRPADVWGCETLPSHTYLGVVGEHGGGGGRPADGQRGGRNHSHGC